MKKYLSYLLILATMFCILGCNTPKEGVSPAPISTDGFGTPIVMPTQTPMISPTAGGTLYMYMPHNADIKDPLTVTTEEMLSMFSLVFESLVQLDDSGLPTPELASNWHVGPDARTWTFSLRSDVAFHGGYGSFTSEDVIYTIDRLIALGDNTYYAHNVSKIESYSAIDDYTVNITFTHEGFSPILLMTFPIVCKAAAQALIPIGTGPYLLTSSSDEEVLLSVNSRWWRTVPYIQNIHFIEKSDSTTALASYAADQLNFLVTDVLYSGSYRETDVTSVTDVLTQNMEVLLFNHRRTCANVNIRKAIAYAINRATIAANVYMYKVQLCDVPIAPDSFAYDPRSKVIEYNKALAQKLLNDVGYIDNDDDGFLEYSATRTELSLTLLVNENKETSVRHDAALLISSQLEAIGIRVNVVVAPMEATGDTISYPELLAGGEFDIALAGFNLAQDLDLTPFLSPSGSQNFGNYNNTQMALAVMDLKVADSQSDMREAANEIMTMFTNDLPFMVLYFRMNSIICSTKIQGIPSSARKPDILSSIASWYMYTN
ncbi:MAG: hypothetical protein IJA35_05890 [Clostridia bacterium]|nr:hypothetical protein [Clostridia bacterium]